MSELLEELYHGYEKSIKAVTIASWEWDTDRKREFALSPDVAYAFVHLDGQYGTVRIPKDGDPQDVTFLSTHPQADQIERDIAEAYDHSKGSTRVKRRIWVLGYDEVAQGEYRTIDEADILLIDDAELAGRVENILRSYGVLNDVTQEGARIFEEICNDMRAEIGLLAMI